MVVMHGPPPLLGVVLAVLDLEEGIAKTLPVPAHQLISTGRGDTSLGRRQPPISQNGDHLRQDDPPPSPPAKHHSWMFPCKSIFSPLQTECVAKHTLKRLCNSLESLMVTLALLASMSITGSPNHQCCHGDDPFMSNDANRSEMNF